MCVYIYIYIYIRASIYLGRARQAGAWVAPLVECYLSNSLIRPSFIFYGVTCLTRLVEFAAFLRHFRRKPALDK